MIKMAVARKVTTLWLLVVLSAAEAELSIGVDGGYTDVLVRVEDGVGVDTCRMVLKQLSELLTNASAVLNSQLDGRAYFHSFLLEVPENWEESRCGYSTDRTAVVGGGAKPEVKLQQGNDEPRVEQVVGCGHSGEGILLSEGALGGMTGEQLVGRWMEQRYGVFDWGEEEEAGVNQTELTRQQEMCGGRSRSQVVNEHADLARVRTDGEPLRALVPEVRVVRRSPEKLIIAVETTQGMLEDDAWRWVNKAVQKLVRWDLPEATDLAVVSFSNSSRVEWAGVLWGQEERDTAADSVPAKYQLASHGALCVSCLVQSVVGGMLDGRRGHLVLLTRGSQGSLSLTDEAVIDTLVSNSGLRLSSLLLPSNSSGTPLAFYDTVAGRSGGRSLLVRPSPSPMASYVGVVAALTKVLDTHSVIHTSPATRDAGFSRGEFSIDRSLGLDTQFGIYVSDPEDHMIRSVSFEDEQGAQYGPYTKMSSSYDLINMKTPNIGEGPRPFFSGGGRRWRYTVEWWGGRGEEQEEGMLLVTSSASKDKEEERKVDGWALVGEKCGEVTIFCRVTRGGKPVVGAEVSATVEVTGAAGEMAVLLLSLVDDGFGEPDLIEGDGVYTAVLAEYPMLGRYSVKLAVEENEDGTAGVEVLGPILHLATLPSPCPPPGRVRDLFVSSYNSSLAASWTSPGGVSSFSLVYSTTIAGLFNSTVGSLLEMEVEEGREEEVRVEDIASPIYQQLFYVALVATDGNGHRSRLSNIEEVWVDEPEVEEVHLLNLPILGLPTPNSSDDWFMIVLVSSGLGGLLLLSLLAIVFFLVTSRKKKRKVEEERVESPVSSTKSPPSVSEYQTDSSSCDSDSRQVTDLRQVMSHLPRAPGHGPTYWSASQILSKHATTSSLSSSFDNQGYGWNGGDPLPPREEEPGSRQGWRGGDSYRNFGAPPTPPKPAHLRSREEEFRRRLSPEDLRLSPEDEGYDSASREVHLIVQARNITEV